MAITDGVNPQLTAELAPPPPPPDLDEVFGEVPTAAETARAYSQENYRVNLPTFEGPLDLLLHLIRKEQMDIYDIPIAQICTSYLSYVEQMQEPDVDMAGEFLVMAATLMHIKSQMLLPKDEEEGGEEEDPRLPLVAQLLEYEKFQKAAEQLNERPWLQRDVFPRPQAASRDLLPKESVADAPIAPVETFKLLVALKGCLDRTTKPPVAIQKDSTSLREKVSEIGNALEEREVVEWAQFIPVQEPKKFDYIIAFLSILELAKLKFIEIIQHKNFGPIQLRRKRSVKELSVTLLDSY